MWWVMNYKRQSLRGLIEVILFWNKIIFQRHWQKNGSSFKRFITDVIEEVFHEKKEKLVRLTWDSERLIK